MSLTRRPAVSIITPAYNAAAFLSETVASALAQSYEDFELLIADDGSTDGTLELARQWERADLRVRAFTAANGGTASARNLAIRHARGSYLALLDSDDVWQRGFLAAQMAVFEQHPEADVVTGNAYSLGGPLDGQPLNPAGTRCRPLPLLEMLENERAVCIMSVFRRSVVDRIGGFDETVQHSEDYDFWIRAAHAGCAFLANPAPLAFYRRRPGSKSADDIAAIRGVIFFFTRARRVCADRPDAIAVIDRQLARFEQELLLAQGKAHLLRREFEAAAWNFDELSARANSFPAAVLASVSRRVPRALLWAYHAKSALRMLRAPLRRAV